MATIIGILFFLWLLTPAKPRKRTRTAPKLITYTQPKPLPVYDPIKSQREQEREADRARREAERLADRQRKEAERARKEAERIAKQDEARQAALDRIEWAGSMIDKYSALLDSIESELANNPGLTAYKTIQLHKQQLAIEEKIHRFKEIQDKSFFTANS